jgi:acetolactate synthase-1/2/3 large subunit
VTEDPGPAPTGVAAAIVAALRRRATDYAFCVPGESYLAAMDAFYGDPEITLVAARHEEGAGLMAEAWAKATGRTGVCFVTRGPGLTHLSIALHTAFQDSTPLVAVVGQVPTSVRHREAFQEMDVVAFSAPVAKWSVELGRADRAEEIVERAFAVAESGRPGPVVISLPEDVDRATEPSTTWRRTARYAPSPSQEAVAEVLAEIRAARRPAMIVGTGAQAGADHTELVQFAERLAAPVFTAWRRFDAFPNDHELYRGPLPVLPARYRGELDDADLLIAVGHRLDEYSSCAYTYPREGQRLVHLDLSAGDRVRPEADVSVEAEVVATLRALNAALPGARVPTPGSWNSDARRRILEATTPRPTPAGAHGLVHPEGIYHDLRAAMTPETVTTSDAGTFAGWLMRFHRWARPRTYFGPTAGGMGYALPAAIGAKLARPEAPVLAFAGDGGFAMTMAELETAVRLQLAGLVCLVFNNSTYGTIKVHQEREFPGRQVATALGDVDFAGVAEAMGATGWRVDRNDEFAAVLAKALDAPGPAVLDIHVHPDLLDPWAGAA